MPLCVYCNTPLKCDCRKAPQPIGQAVKDCPLKVAGKLWIHVTDDAGENIKGAAVTGPTQKNTDASGLAIFESLKSDDYTAELIVPLSSKLSPRYDAPEAIQLKKQVKISEGTLAYVLFTLTRKSTLKIEFIYVSDPKKSIDTEPFKVSTVKAKAVGKGGGTFDPSTDTGEITIDVPAGKYDVTPDYTGVDATEFDFSSETRPDVDLPPGGSETVVFKLARKAKLKVEIIYKRNSSKTDTKEYLKDVVEITADFDGNDFHPKGQTKEPTNKGIADFKSVSAGKYKLTPDYSKVPKCTIDYKDESLEIELLPGDDKTIEIEVEPLYQTVQFIAHCLLTIPDRVYVPQDPEKLIATGTKDPEKPTYRLEPVTEEKNYKGEWKGKYHGLEDERKDMDARVEFLQYALDEAHAHNKTDHERTNLKVFIVPECYFQGLYGAYLFENVGYLFEKLIALTSDEKWRDWLFALGTVNCIETGISIVDPQTQKAGGTGIPQMMNYSPVIRGGLAAGGKGGGSETDPQFRLIQKLVNSAELLDDVEVIPHAGYNPNAGRKIAANQDVQFQGTQNEDKVAAILSRIIDNTDKEYDKDAEAIFCNQCGLPASQWQELLEVLQKDVNALGIVRVVRSIRTCNIDGKTDDLSKWGYSGFVDKSKGHLNTNETDLTDARSLLLGLVEGQWIRDFEVNPTKDRAPGFDLKAWKTVIGTERLDRILKAVKGDLENAEIQLEYQKKELLEGIQAVMTDNARVSAFFNSSPLKPLMQGKWEEDYVNNPPVKPRFAKTTPPPLAFSLENWNTLMEATDKTRINRIHDQVRAGMDAEAIAISCSKQDLERELDQLLASRNKTIEFFDASLKRAPGTFGLSIYPVWKKLLELYCKKKPIADAPLTQAAHSMNYRDYCFAGVRKAGPFVTWSDAEKLEGCRKLTFGLEICADHAAGRLKNALLPKPSDPPKPTIDIQLVPSAGMTLAQGYIVARDGGYAFNCDGWNGREVDRNEGTYLKVWFDAPICETKNPVLPHSALGKGGAALSRKDFVAVRHPLDGDKAKILFAKGAGELHLYDKQPLPK